MTDKLERFTVWEAKAQAPFKKVIVFDLLFLALGAMIWAGIITAILAR